MKKLFNWIRFCFGVSDVYEGLGILYAKINKLHQLKIRSDKDISKHLDTLTSLMDKITEEINKATSSLNNATELNNKLEAALNATQDELKTANEVLIPGLIAANDVLVSRWAAETAVYARRVAVESITQTEIE